MVTQVSDTVVQGPWEKHFARIEDDLLGALEFKVAGGVITDNNNWFEVDDTTLTLPDNATTDVVVNYEDGVVSLASASSSSKYFVCYEVTTASGVITTVTDKRTSIIKKGQFVATWADAVAALQPSYWYTFEEATGNIINQGYIANPSDYDFVPGSYGNVFNATYQVPTITNTGNTGMEFNGGGRLRPSTSWGGFYGTVFMIVNLDGTVAGQFNFMGGVSENFDQTQIQFIALTSGTSHHNIRVYKEPSPTGGTPLSHEATDAATLWPFNSGWHSFAIRQNNDLNLPDLFIDGNLVARSDLGVTGGSMDYQWFGSIVPARETTWGARSGVSSSIKAEFITDELLYFQSIELSNGDISALHAAAFG